MESTRIYDEEQLEALAVRDDLINALAEADKGRTSELRQIGGQLADAFDLLGDARVEFMRAAQAVGDARCALEKLESNQRSADFGLRPGLAPDVYQQQRTELESAQSDSKARVDALIAGLPGQGRIIVRPREDGSAWVMMNNREFAEQGPQLLDRVLPSPLILSMSERDASRVRETAASPRLAEVRDLDVSFYDGTAPEAIREFFASPNVRNKISLAVSLPDGMLDPVLGGLGDDMPALRKFGAGPLLSAAELDRLAAWPGLRHLSELAINVADGVRVPDELLAAVPPSCTIGGTRGFEPDSTARVDAHNERIYRAQTALARERESARWAIRGRLENPLA